MFPKTNLLSICSIVFALSNTRLGIRTSSSPNLGVSISFQPEKENSNVSPAIGILPISQTSPSILPVPLVLGIQTNLKNENDVSTFLNCSCIVLFVVTPVGDPCIS